MKRYLLLWSELKDREFSFDDAERILSKMAKPDSKKVVGLFLSELRKAGWVKVELNQADTRKRVYRLKPYELIFKTITDEQMGVSE
jgi:hypothetical protein